MFLFPESPVLPLLFNLHLMQSHRRRLINTWSGHVSTPVATKATAYLDPKLANI
jgi:hypothetical protein